MDIDQYIRFVMALALVLVLIVLVLWLLKRVGMAGVAVGGPKTRRRRLQVVEALALDTRRRLVLVRRDGMEHLLLLGASGDLLIESGIGDPKDFADGMAALAAASAAAASVPEPEEEKAP
jgi:flagellar protein FliO/FliZ